MARSTCPISGIRASLAAAILSFAAVTPAAAQPLTLDQAVQAALARNASLRAARAGADEAAARADAAHAGYFPTLSFAETWQRGDQPVFVFSSLLSARRFAASNFAIDALNHPSPIGFFRASAGVEQLLYDGGRQHGAADVAARQRDAAVATSDEAAAAVAVATTETFGRVIAAEAARRAADAGLASAREDLARAERRRDAGMVSDADVLALAVHVADLRERLIRAEGDAATARAELNRLTGTPVDADTQTVLPPAPNAAEFGDRPNLALLFAEADGARPEIKRAAALHDAAEAVRRGTGGALLPRIAAQAAFDLSGNSFADRASSWIVGGELRWTFSTGGAEIAARRAAAASVARAQADADEARAAVHVEVIGALRRLEGANARADAGRAAVEQSRESQRIIRDRFDAGIASANDVLRASTALVDAEERGTAALVDALVARARLRRALGRTP
jgi:outer membrane protein TolC